MGEKESNFIEFCIWEKDIFLIIIIYFLNIVDVKNCGSSKSHVTSSKEVNNFGFIVCVYIYIYIKLGNTKVMINDKYYIYIYIYSIRKRLSKKLGNTNNNNK